MPFDELIEDDFVDEDGEPVQPDIDDRIPTTYGINEEPDEDFDEDEDDDEY